MPVLRAAELPESSASIVLGLLLQIDGDRIEEHRGEQRRRASATAKGARRKPQTETPLARATTSSSLRDRPSRLISAANRKAKGRAVSSRIGTRISGKLKAEQRR